MQPDRLKPQSSVHRRGGSTLMELLMTLCIVGISAALALPSLGAMIGQLRVSSLADTFSRSVQRARSEAIHRNARVVLCKSADGVRCTSQGGYEQGWILFQDANNNAQLEAQDTVIEVVQRPSDDLQLHGNRPVSHYVSFTGLGLPSTIRGDFQAGTWIVCRSSTQPGIAHSIALSKTGNVRSYKSTLARCG